MAERKDRAGVNSPWEWVAGGISALAVLAALAVLIADAARPGTPPDIRVRVDSVIPVGDRYLTTLTVRNQGSAAAEELVLEARIPGAAGNVERNTVTIQYLPGRSERRVGLYFRTEPRRHTLAIEPRSYREP